MTSLGRWTMRTLAVSGTLVMGTLLAWGQGGNPPASTAESGATSGHGMTAVEQTYGNAEPQIKALHEEGRQAALKDDAGFFEKHLSSQYFGIGADGHLRTKAETVENFKSGGVKYESINESDVRINTFGNTAVVHSLASVKGTMEGKPISGDYRATFVYVKEGANWKEVAFQVTAVSAGK